MARVLTATTRLREVAVHTDVMTIAEATVVIPIGDAITTEDQIPTEGHIQRPIIVVLTTVDITPIVIITDTDVVKQVVTTKRQT